MLRSPDSPRGVAIFLTPILFTLFLCLPELALLMDWEIYSDVEEKRSSIPMPGFPTDSKSLDAFPAKFDAYYSDNFGLRADFITFHNLLFYVTTGSLPGNRVVAGKDSWLFGKLNQSIQSFQHRLPPFTPAHLDILAHRLQQRQAWLHSRGIAYLFFVTPAKSTIYPDKMPDRLRIKAGGTRLAQARRYFADRPEIPFHDTTQALIDARRMAMTRGSDAELYYRTDTHWNTLGATIAFMDVQTELRSRYRESYDLPQPIALELYLFEKVPYQPGDLSRMAGISLLVSETRAAVGNPLLHLVARPIHNQVPYSYHMTSKWEQYPDILMFHDSFGEMLRLPLSNVAKESYFFLTPDFLPKLIEQYKPRVVLTQITERFLNIREQRNPVSIRLLDKAQVALDWKGRGEPSMSDIHFESGLVLQACELRDSGDDLEIRMIWRADQDMVLDGAFRISLVARDWAWNQGKLVEQCPDKTEVQAGSLWEDRLYFRGEDVDRADKLYLELRNAKGVFIPGKRGAKGPKLSSFMVPRANFLRLDRQR